MSDIDYHYCLNCNQPLIQHGWSINKKLCNRTCIDQFVKFRNRLKASEAKCELWQKEIALLTDYLSEITIEKKEKEIIKVTKKLSNINLKHKTLATFCVEARKKLEIGYPAKKLNQMLTTAKKVEIVLSPPVILG